MTLGCPTAVSTVGFSELSSPRPSPPPFLLSSPSPSFPHPRHVQYCPDEEPAHDPHRWVIHQYVTAHPCHWGVLWGGAPATRHPQVLISSWCSHLCLLFDLHLFSPVKLYWGFSSLSVAPPHFTCHRNHHSISPEIGAGGPLGLWSLSCSPKMELLVKTETLSLALESPCWVPSQAPGQILRQRAKNAIDLFREAAARTSTA